MIFWDTFVRWHWGLSWAAANDMAGLSPVLSIAGGKHCASELGSAWNLGVLPPGCRE